MMFRDKRGLSEVVTTVLLIMLTVSAFGLIAYFIMPFIRGELGKSDACMSVREKITIGTYTCYSSNNTMVEIARSVKDESQLKGFIVGLKSEADSKRYEIDSEGQGTGVKIYRDRPPRIPAPGESETYVFENFAGTEIVTIIPIVGNNYNCDEITGEVKRC